MKVLKRVKLPKGMRLSLIYDNQHPVPGFQALRTFYVLPTVRVGIVTSRIVAQSGACRCTVALSLCWGFLSFTAELRGIPTHH